MSSNPLFERDNTCKSDEEFFKTRFKRLCDCDITSDCEFKVGPKKVVIKGHKVIFSTASEVFYAMFYGNLKEESAVVISDLKPEGFQGLKQFIYTGEVNFESVMQALSTLIAGQKYLIPQLDAECIRYIKEKINPSNVLELYEGSKLANISEFDEKFLQIVSNRSYDVFNSNSFLSAKGSTINLILRINRLSLKSEKELYDYFEKWAFAEAERRSIKADKMASFFHNITRYVRFLSMDAKEFASIASKSQLLTESEKLAIALNLINFGSMPYPDNLSAFRGKRMITNK